MRNFYYLRMGQDYLDEAVRYPTKHAAVSAYRETMEELWRYGQSIEATIHISPSKDEIAEYPDFVLSRGERGGVRIEST